MRHRRGSSESHQMKYVNVVSKKAEKIEKKKRKGYRKNGTTYTQLIQSLTSSSEAARSVSGVSPPGRSRRRITIARCVISSESQRTQQKKNSQKMERRQDIGKE